VRGQVAFVTADTTQLAVIQAFLTDISTIEGPIARPDANNDTFPVTGLTWRNFVPGDNTMVVPTATGHLNIADTQTIYLGANSEFSVSTVQAYGFIAARRMR
jgi:hypothetical protein